jgi:hypothetical protein
VGVPQTAGCGSPCDASCGRYLRGPK